MKTALGIAAAVYVAGVIVARWKLDTAPNSNGTFALAWPYHFAKHPKDYALGLKYAFTTKAA